MKFEKNSFYGYYSFILFLSILISCGSEEDLQTNNVPKIETVSISEITTSSAITGGKNLKSDGSPIEEKGICWSTEDEPTVDDVKTSNGDADFDFTSEITGLDANTTYYVRAYATNKYGTGYGKTLTFKTEEQKIEYGANVKDIDGNEYHTVIIGTQTWMVENLMVTKYNDGTTMETTETDGDWNKLINGGYCWNNNDIASKEKFGAIYNWYAVNTKKLTPKGWHVPDNQEWETLINYLGGSYLAGGKLKETGTSHWTNPNLASNETGFNAVPAGVRNYFGTYSNYGTTANFWSSTVPADVNASVWMLTNEHTGLTTFTLNKASGFSVRCIKD